MAGLSFYLKKPGRPELGWLIRCACCRELQPRKEQFSQERALFVGQDLLAVFCSSERCEATVRLQLREMFGELMKPSAPGVIPDCALCGKHDRCGSLRYADETLAWICVGCLDFAREGIAKAWPDALPYVDDAGFPTERPAFDRPECVDELAELMGVAARPLKPARRIRAGVVRDMRRRWTRGVVWFPDEYANQDRGQVLNWSIPAPFRPFALLLWCGADLVVRDIRCAGQSQLINDAGIVGVAFGAEVRIERFRELVSPPGRGEGGLPTITDRDWDRLQLERANGVPHFEMQTLVAGQFLSIRIEGRYWHGCVIGKVLVQEQPAAPAERGEA